MDNKTRVIVALAATLVLLPITYFVTKRVVLADEELWTPNEDSTV